MMAKVAMLLNIAWTLVLCTCEVDVTLLPTQNATSTCPRDTQYIYRNGEEIMSSDGDYPQYVIQTTSSYIEITFKDTLASNSTTVSCKDAGSQVLSSARYLVVGTPLAPYPYLQAINTSALLLQWEEPFTWKGVADIGHYTVRMYDGTSGSPRRWIIPASNGLYCVSEDSDEVDANCSLQTTVEADTNTTVNILTNGTVKLLFTANPAPIKCRELVFYVSASNPVGESERLAVRGRVRDASHENSTIKVSVATLRQANGEKILMLDIELPHSCEPHEVIVTVVAIINQNQSEIAVWVTSVHHNNDPIIFCTPSGLITNETTEVYVTASTSTRNMDARNYSTMVTLMATNASKKNGDYEMCSTGCKNNANNKLPCLLQLIIPAVVVTSLCVIMTITFALAICLFNGYSKVTASRTETVNPLYNNGEDALYDYITQVALAEGI